MRKCSSVLNEDFQFGKLYVFFTEKKQSERSDISEREDSQAQKKEK